MLRPRRRTLRRKHRRNKTRSQRGGELFGDAAKPLTYEALKVLSAEHVDTTRSGLEKFLFEDGHFSEQGAKYVLGSFTFQRARRGMSRLTGLRVYKTEKPDDFVTLEEYD